MSRFWRARLKTGIILLTGSLVGLCGLWLFIFPGTKPPKEKKLIANFYAHRAAYERLRNMLLEDEQVKAVYPRFGVETTDSGPPRKPSEVNFPLGRYDEYVGLLAQVGSSAVFRAGNIPKLICVNAWAAGWAGDTRHVWICSTDHVPTTVANLDDY